jgi:hypothetical protein
MTGALDAIAVRAAPRRAWARLLAAAAAGTVLVALGPAASAGASGVTGAPTKTVPAGSWSRQVCQALTTYKNEVGKIEKNFTAKLKHPKSLDEVKSKFSAFLQLVVSRTDKLIASLRRVGEPKVPSGPDITVAIQNGFLQLRDNFRALFTESQQIPTTDATAFRTAFATLQTNLSGAETDNQAFFRRASRFDSPELSRAFNGQAACKPFKST